MIVLFGLVIDGGICFGCDFCFNVEYACRGIVDVGILGVCGLYLWCCLLFVLVFAVGCRVVLFGVLLWLWLHSFRVCV